MKFSCEACAARYYMDDEKVRHKTLRIRCKKCGNVMTVGDGATTLVEQGSGEQAAETEPRAAQLPTAESVWFYAAAGQTYGPYTEVELLRRFEAGRIAEEVHVWRQGFAEWVPARTVEAFADAISLAKPTRQPTQSIDIASLNLVTPAAAHAAAAPEADAEARARITALRDGLRKSRGAESSLPGRGTEPKAPATLPEPGQDELGSLLDGSIADATANLVAKAQAAQAATEPVAENTASAPPTPADPISGSAPIEQPSSASAIPRLPVLADAGLLPQGQGAATGAMASGVNGAPTASLMLQIEQGRSANRKRLLIGGLVAAALIGGLLLMAKRETNAVPDATPSEAARKAIPKEFGLTPEQEALRADRTDNAVSTAKGQVRSAIREGASSAVTAIMKKRMAEDALRKKQGVAQVKRATKVVFDEETGAISERDANAPDPAPPAPTVSASARARGLGVAIAAPKPGKVSNPAALPASFFNSGLRKVEESIQYCNQRQLSAEGPLRKPRVELRFSIMPSGRVSTVDFNADVASTTFAGCMRGRKERWIFSAFEGEPLQIAKTYIVE